MRKIKHTGVLYRLAYFWHKPEERPTDRVYICDTVGLAFLSFVKMIGMLIVIFIAGSLVVGFVVGGAQLIFSGLAAVGSGTLWLLSFTELSAAATTMEIAPVILAAVIGLIVVIAVVAVILFAANLCLAPVRELYVARLRSLKERYCPEWEVV